ncbi:beta-ketoacyl synthase chain length factor [Pandoraea sp.]|uniref:beta-ketoacyl synthase chain length factor n=1 Tax=Pandoraea sp. TaxID=1883445 RepID=UPI00121F1566|nr:beta-ketoacyl synthase chain length factor [Pandoraea sp.]TAL53622.1 MAG: hypothetical protein EPN80_15165 [Pandoraea sp.]TAM14835.1 MAG: hypothetical protein EPN65_19875 [Pandoraea sp.]
MTPLFVDAVEMLGPGVRDWAQGAALLREPCDGALGDLPSGEPSMLAPNERRRTTTAIRLALRVTEQLAARAPLDVSRIASVFTSSAGDLQVTDRVCMALGQPGAPVSPIHFHNIVHNATAGYWSIGAHAQAGSVSLSAGEASFAAGLLEALSIVVSEQAPVLLVSYEQPAPAIIDRHLPICAPFATAMLVSGQAPGATGWALNVERIPYCPATRMAHPAWERLRAGNAAARALPMLECMATDRRERIFLDAGGAASVAVDIAPIGRA